LKYTRTAVNIRVYIFYTGAQIDYKKEFLRLEGLFQKTIIENLKVVNPK
jgi:hypothetical protein